MSLKITHNIKTYFFSFGVLIFSLLNVANAQSVVKKELAIYATSEVFSLKAIEQCLLTLTNKDTDTLLFRKGQIVNFNDLIKAQENQVEAENALNNLLLGRTYVINDSTKKNLDEVGYNIRKYKHFLQVNTISFEGFIEYQLLLYPVLNDTSSLSGILDFNNVEFTTRIFKRDTKVADLQRIIENALKDLFFESHSVPIGKLSVDLSKINGQFDSISNVVYSSVGDTIYLDALRTIDTDTPIDFLKFNWEVISPYDESLDKSVYVKNEDELCKIVLHSEGIYKVVLEVYDGVQKTNSLPYGALSRDTIEIFSVIDNKARLYPRKIISHFVKSLDDDISLFVPDEKIIVSTTLPSVKVYTRDDRLLISSSGDETLDEVDHIITHPNTRLIKVSYSSLENIYEEIPVRITDSYGTFVEKYLTIDHRVYQPYHLGLFWNINDITLNTEIENLKGKTFNWNYSSIYLHSRLLRELEVGLGWGIRNKRFNINPDLAISSSFELFASYNGAPRFI